MKSDQEIRFGSVNDSPSRLKTQSEEQARRLSATLDIPPGETLEVPFWTSDIPELVCVASFYKDDSGATRYRLDFSQATV